jgi:hypothetical protein
MAMVAPQYFTDDLSNNGDNPRELEFVTYPLEETKAKEIEYLSYLLTNYGSYFVVYSVTSH